MSEKENLAVSNNYTYAFHGKEDFSNLINYGYNITLLKDELGNDLSIAESISTSTDGEYAVFDMGTSEPNGNYDPDLPMPSYVTEEEMPYWPLGNQKQVLKVMRKIASFKGASDGFVFYDEIP